ncbi:hypothetical protein Syn8016DRAFT_1967 [Synechococcus sp. WH 8016]|nr:hypothetical protein Syn8016DRAFT_1967 [Synechococcus sp. WH 8016]
MSAPSIKRHTYTFIGTKRVDHEYLILHAALGDNPTKEEVDTVATYGFQRHRIYLASLHQMHICSNT